MKKSSENIIKNNMKYLENQNREMLSKRPFARLVFESMYASVMGIPNLKIDKELEKELNELNDKNQKKII